MDEPDHNNTYQAPQQPYQAPQQQPYQAPQQPMYQNPMAYRDDAPLTVGNYIVMYLIELIPFVNIIMLFVWAFGSYNQNKKNWARAALIILGVILAITIIVIAVIGATGNFHPYSYYYSYSGS